MVVIFLKCSGERWVFLRGLDEREREGEREFMGERSERDEEI